MADRSHTHYQDGRRPPERVPKSERILNLIAVLLRSDKPVPVTEILGKVTGYDDAASRESLMRRFERDKKVLRDIGIPIEHSSPGTFGQEGYYISRKDYFLGELKLPPESGQVLRALYAWAHADGGQLSADLRSALVKLGFLVEAESPPPPEATEALEPRPGPTTEAGSVTGNNLELLSEAVLRQKRVRFRYYTLGKDRERERRVDPYGLGFSSQAWGTGSWYLVGRDVDLDEGQPPRVYRLSRIRGEVAFLQPEGDDPDYRIPNGFRVREHLGKTRFEYLVGGGEEGQPFTAQVAFPAAVATEVRSLVRSARVVDQGGDDELLEFEVVDRLQFLRFLLRYVPRVRAVQPPDLHEALRALARQVLARYGGAS